MSKRIAVASFALALMFFAIFFLTNHLKYSIYGFHWISFWLCLVFVLVAVSVALWRRAPLVAPVLAPFALLALIEALWWTVDVATDSSKIEDPYLVDALKVDGIEVPVDAVLQWDSDRDYMKMFTTKEYFSDAIRLYHMPRSFRSPTVNINSMGYRGKEIGPKDPNVMRVLYLGGSGAFSHQVTSDEKAASAVLERQLNERTGKSFEVINMATPHGTTVLDYVALSAYGEELSPDYVVLYTGINDLKGNMRTFASWSKKVWRYLNDHSLSDKIGNLAAYSALCLRDFLSRLKVFKFMLAQHEALLGGQVKRSKPIQSDFDGFLESYRINLQRVFRLSQRMGWKVVVYHQTAASSVIVSRQDSGQKLSRLDESFLRFTKGIDPLQYENLVNRRVSTVRNLQALAQGYGYDYVDFTQQLATLNQPIIQSAYINIPANSLYTSTTHMSDFGNAVLAALIAKDFVTRFSLIPAKSGNK